MDSSMNRDSLQRLALTRLKDAEVLYENGRYEAAYYLAGYVIECALKACIAKKTREYDFPPPKKTIEKIYTHDLTKLLNESGLTLEDSIKVNWSIAKEWYEGIRYEEINEQKSKDVYAAIADPEEGVFQWIRQHW